MYVARILSTKTPFLHLFFCKLTRKKCVNLSFDLAKLVCGIIFDRFCWMLFFKQHLKTIKMRLANVRRKRVESKVNSIKNQHSSSNEPKTLSIFFVRSSVMNIVCHPFAMNRGKKCRRLENEAYLVCYMYFSYAWPECFRISHAHA